MLLEVDTEPQLSDVNKLLPEQLTQVASDAGMAERLVKDIGQLPSPGLIDYYAN